MNRNFARISKFHCEELSDEETSSPRDCIAIARNDKIIPLKTIRPLPGVKHKNPACQPLSHLPVTVYGFLKKTDYLINRGSG